MTQINQTSTADTNFPTTNMDYIYSWVNEVVGIGAVKLPIQFHKVTHLHTWIYLRASNATKFSFPSFFLSFSNLKSHFLALFVASYFIVRMWKGECGVFGWV